MVSTRSLQLSAPGDRDIVRGLEDAARRHDGHGSLGASVWRDLETPTSTSVGILATDGDQPIGYAHLAPSDTFASPHLVAGLVVDPGHRKDGTVTRALLDSLAREAAGLGGKRIVLWVNGADDELDTLATDAGFRRLSEQLQMRVPLPIPESPRWPPGITLRTFVPGRDDADWLRVNNRAFRNHPDQGAWVEATLQRRMLEAWFDPNGFLLAFDEAGPQPALAGFCWTKVHDAESPADRLGEIYVIGVDPDHHGIGLGRALPVAGLQHLAEGRGCRTGMLYVASDNDAALGLYRSLGFQVHRTDRAYEYEGQA